ncbi:hypothetical protein LCGC14_1554730 [marine sediment metagenome]|uniref:Helix-turn-helix domain-containing protein n=1 Tax=marine sediment metagenome TaxID=412755 RepID=A0A0F9JA94_9ZZZZ
MSNYYTVSQLSQKHPAFSIGSLRSIIFNRDKNGFNKVIRRIGRKILLSEEDFLEWIESAANAEE